MESVRNGYFAVSQVSRVDYDELESALMSGAIVSKKQFFSMALGGEEISQSTRIQIRKSLFPEFRKILRDLPRSVDGK